MPVDLGPHGVPIASLRQQLAVLGVGGFERDVARLFLLVDRPRDVSFIAPAVTLVPDATLDGDEQGDLRGTPHHARGSLERVAYPLRRRPSSTHPFISIGRVEGNDVALVDLSVSKFHAYVKEQDGVFLLQDARSRNGTLLNGRAVPTRGNGPPLELTPGAVVHFGNVVALVAGVRELV